MRPETMQITPIEVKECEESFCHKNAEIRLLIGGKPAFLCLDCLKNLKEIINSYDFVNDEF